MCTVFVEYPTHVHNKNVKHDIRTCSWLRLWDRWHRPNAFRLMKVGMYVQSYEMMNNPYLLPDFCCDAMHFSRLCTFAMNSSLISDHIAPLQKFAIAQHNVNTWKILKKSKSAKNGPLGHTSVRVFNSCLFHWKSRNGLNISTSYNSSNQSVPSLLHSLFS